jgi:hypothetical protein
MFLGLWLMNCMDVWLKILMDWFFLCDFGCGILTLFISLMMCLVSFYDIFLASLWWFQSNDFRITDFNLIFISYSFSCIRMTMALLCPWLIMWSHGLIWAISSFSTSYALMPCFPDSNTLSLHVDQNPLKFLLINS